MDPVRLAVLMAGVFFLAFGLAAYRFFHAALGAAAGLALWIALSDTLVLLPGLREHPGTAGVLLLVFLVFACILLASKFRKLLTFLSGLAVGLILSQKFSIYMAAGTFSGAVFSFGGIDAMDILVGLVGGIFCLLFERFFAVVLTSVVGASLCAWAFDVAWTFPVCMLAGLLAQPMIFSKLRTSGPSDGGGTTKSTTVAF